MAQDNVDVIQSAWDAFAKGDIEAATSIVAPEGEITAPSTLPWGGTFLGPEGFQDFLRGLLSHFKDFKATPEKVLGADDDHVIVTAQIRGRTKSGTPIENRSVWVYKLRGGQVESAEAFSDTAQLLKALDSTAAS
jgi:ketosteroid isomerase-like protein